MYWQVLVHVYTNNCYLLTKTIWTEPVCYIFCYTDDLSLYRWWISWMWRTTISWDMSRLKSWPSFMSICGTVLLITGKTHWNLSLDRKVTWSSLYRIHVMIIVIYSLVKKHGQCKVLWFCVWITVNFLKIIRKKF